MKVRYVVSPEDIPSHYLHVAVEVSGLAANESEVQMVMPVWTPGSYLVREFARMLRRVQAVGEDGRSLSFTKVRKNRWKVLKGKEASFTFSYSVYAHDISVEGIDLTEDHLYFNGAPLFCYVDGSKDDPVELVVHVPSGWKVYSELQEVGKNPPRFRAENFDQLCDSPFDAGSPTEIAIRPAGVPHRIVLCGKGNFSPHKVEEDVRKIVEATYRLFGELPMPRYTFFYHLNEKWDGGLEHLAGTAITLPSVVFAPRKEYEVFLDVTCHEYFHLFNVKRIRPKVLGPFDYEQENYTRMLWAMEGTTDYYTYLLLRRAGLYSPKKYLEKVGEQVKKFREIPGRNHQSLEEASFDSWIDLYRPGEETRNISISYYLKGNLVSLCMDLEIRGKSQNAHSLDDVMRHLWQEFGKKGAGIPEGDWQKEAERATGVELGGFFDRYVRGRDDIDFATFLRHAGLTLEPKDDEATEGEDPPELPGYLGVEFKREGDRPRVTVALDGGPGRRAGLTPGDELLAFDGYRVTYDSVGDMLKKFPPGEKVSITLFRRGILRTLEATLGKAPPSKWTIKADPSASEVARKVAEAWLETKWESLAPKNGEKEARPSKA
ncbi:MAG: M61 family metallopeptidase [Euryarchaeota archaeon]|nr:M61 family metallopeptidase [Euryarchaeota archaeon]MDE2046184.1 M61 family metallopeptidase [Thermoplasmata archaeon]